MKKIIFIVTGLFLFQMWPSHVAPVSAETQTKAEMKKAERRKARAKKRRQEKARKAKANQAQKHKSAVAVKEAAPAQKEPTLSTRVLSWLDKMKKRVARSHAKHNQLVSVAAVRGAESDEAPPLYWKGKKSEGPVALPELEAFDAAIDDAVNGRSEKAIQGLENFVKNHPKSSLLGDAQHTLLMLKEESAE